MKRLLFAVLLSVLGSAALAQSFSDEPTDALKATQGLAQEIVNDPLRLEGLISVVFRYNAFRAEVAPAGMKAKIGTKARYSLFSSKSPLWRRE